MTDNIKIIYHKNCTDGFGAAYAAWKYFGDKAEYIPMSYGDDTHDIQNAIIIFVDFCLSPEHLINLSNKNNKILILDHHISAYNAIIDYGLKSHNETNGQAGSYFDDMSNYLGRVDFKRFIKNTELDYCENHPPYIYHLFDMNRSGAIIAWDFFHDEPAPKLLQHIQDRDLWKFELEGTKEIQAALYSYKYDFGLWNKLILEVEDLEKEGFHIDRAKFKNINEIVETNKHYLTVDGHIVPACNVPYVWASDTAGILCDNQPFAVCYSIKANEVAFSLRSKKEQLQSLDVSVIAKKYGGGGHKHASGFRTSLSEFARMIGTYICLN